MDTLILTQRDIRSLITMAEVVPAVERAFLAHGRGEGLMPPKVYIDLPQHHGDFRAMPAYLEGAAGVKWVNSHPQNPVKHGLPSVMGVYILSDPETAQPLAIMDATWLTALRTGAAGAVASKYLAVGKPRSLGFIGCGVQARVLLAAHREVFGDSLELLMADASSESAARFAEEAGGTAVSRARAAGCDVVCTSTPARAPVVERGWVSSGAHINAIGADGHGKQELDPAILRDAKVVIDEREQASHSGEIHMPIERGDYALASVHGTLGEVVAGQKSGRTGSEITVFDSTGLAIQDVAVAHAIYELARTRDIGQSVDITSA
ncbi:ornithine cyclodeaminase family protein [Haliangium ochraceum]|uniref:Putative alanine dehydrogenase n=1 Tax=Haliangium ochraceum (strain DSM 14365 / JCM 11303 / SMP-2) TaxID=502025 RepID=D0LLZ3_HALO1|nr:alanine dehydrogenase [Haliangium ochraceum]ACY15171.1 Ornithine cyclodeaminase [Haliangium ochraceum DSM 14365]